MLEAGKGKEHKERGTKMQRTCCPVCQAVVRRLRAAQGAQHPCSGRVVLGRVRDSAVAGLQTLPGYPARMHAPGSLHHICVTRCTRCTRCMQAKRGAKTEKV